MIYQQAIEEELKQGIVKKDQERRRVVLQYDIHHSKKKDKRPRKILDCRPINKFLKEDSFKSEDIKTVTQLSLINDWATVINIRNAYNHIQVAKELQQFLAFTINYQTYTYIGMPFGLKTAAFIFLKHLQPAIQIMKEEDLTIRMIEEIRRNMINKLLKWNRKSTRGQIVQTRELAKIIGKLEFLKPQFPRILLLMKLLYKLLSHATRQQGWSGYLKLNPKLRRDRSWSLSLIRKSVPQHFQIIPSQAILTKDASRRGWGATFQIISQSTEIKCGAKWKKKWILKTSNQSELAAVYCALLRFGQQLQEEKIHSIHFKTDNTTTNINIIRKNSSRTLSYLTDQTHQLAECLKIQLKVTYIPGMENQTTDSLSQLNRAGNYYLKMRIAEQVFKTMQFIPTIDLFANRKTKLTKRYCTINLDHLAVARYAFSISWKAEQPVIHPPIPLIGHCLQRIKQEKIAAIMIVPNWEGQY
ncbi:MAG: putative reverse transcriptase, partial [Streblomastix strix]